MKVGGARRVETIYRQRFPGLRFTHEPNPTQSLPRRPGLIYFQVDRESEPEEWRQVVESQSLAYLAPLSSLEIVRQALYG